MEYVNVKLNLCVNGKHKKNIPFNNTPYFNGVFGGASTKFANVGNYSLREFGIRKYL